MLSFQGLSVEEYDKQSVPYIVEKDVYEKCMNSFFDLEGKLFRFLKELLKSDGVIELAVNTPEKLLNMGEAETKLINYYFLLELLYKLSTHPNIRDYSKRYSVTSLKIKTILDVAIKNIMEKLLQVYDNGYYDFGLETMTIMELLFKNKIDYERQGEIFSSLKKMNNIKNGVILDGQYRLHGIMGVDSVLVNNLKKVEDEMARIEYERKRTLMIANEKFDSYMSDSRFDFDNIMTVPDSDLFNLLFVLDVFFDNLSINIKSLNENNSKERILNIRKRLFSELMRRIEESTLNKSYNGIKSK